VSLDDRIARSRVVVHGRVQGVWFRQSCADEARVLGLVGWVRNRPDGSVEAEVEGDAAAVGALVEWMATGPPLAVVERVERQQLTPTGAESTFAVR
jgi:acylphosphatase